METISDYIFTELGVNPDDVLEIYLNTGRYDCKQILLKPNIDTSKLTSDFPDTFNGYSINVTKLTEPPLGSNSTMFLSKFQMKKF